MDQISPAWPVSLSLHKLELLTFPSNIYIFLGMLGYMLQYQWKLLTEEIMIFSWVQFYNQFDNIETLTAPDY